MPKMKTSREYSCKRREEGNHAYGCGMHGISQHG